MTASAVVTVETPPLRVLVFVCSTCGPATWSIYGECVICGRPFG